MTIEEELNFAEKLTQSGNRNQALIILKKIIQNTPKREYLVKLAQLCNRNNAYVMAMRVLYPIVVDQQKDFAEMPTPLEINTYATSLVWIGSLKEAEFFLKKITHFYPSWLTTAFLHMGRWEYRKAIPILKKYIRSKELNPYQVLVGEVNLLSAYVSLRMIQDAENLFEKLQNKLNPDEHQLLLGNSYELIGQLKYFQGQFENAAIFLKKAQLLLKDRAYRYRIFVDKWLCVLNLHCNPENINFLNELLEIKKEATQIKLYETIRDCDFHLARLTNNYDLMTKVYWGSSIRGYKKILLDNYSSEFEKLKKHSNTVFDNKQIKTFSYKPNNNLKMELNTKSEFITSNIQHTLELNLMDLPTSIQNNKNFWIILNETTKDIYKPPQMGTIFHALYPDEYFNPFTSPSRVRNLIKRLNNHFNQQSEIPILRFQKGNLVFDPNLNISIIRPIQSFEYHYQFLLKVFRNKWGPRSFNYLHFSNQLKIPQLLAKKILNQAEKTKEIIFIGSSEKKKNYLFFGKFKKSQSEK